MMKTHLKTLEELGNNGQLNTRTHTHEEIFPNSQQELFSLLHTPSAIRGWWGVSSAIVLPETGGTWAATWGESEDNPDYASAATISLFDPPRKMVLSDYRYYSKANVLPFQADFTTEFIVSPQADGAILTVIQSGFPAGSEADDYYAACQQGWKDTFAGIRQYLINSASTNIT